MDKATFIALMSGKSGSTKKDTEANLDAFLAVVTETLQKGDDVPFIGFGTFKVTTRAARKGRNPGTGASIDIPESKAVTFKVGAKLKEAVSPSKKK